MEENKKLLITGGVTNLAEAILKIVNNKDYLNKELTTEIYHYSNEGEISWYDSAQEIFKLAKIDCKVSPINTEQFPMPAMRPKSTLMNKIWGAEIYVEDRTIDVHITRLRKALSRSSNTQFELIKTIRSVGYILKS